MLRPLFFLYFVQLVMFKLTPKKKKEKEKFRKKEKMEEIKMNLKNHTIFGLLSTCLSLKCLKLEEQDRLYLTLRLAEKQ